MICCWLTYLEKQNFIFGHEETRDIVEPMISCWIPCLLVELYSNSKIVSCGHGKSKQPIGLCACGDNVSTQYLHRCFWTVLFITNSLISTKRFACVVALLLCSPSQINSYITNTLFASQPDTKLSSIGYYRVTRPTWIIYDFPAYFFVFSLEWKSKIYYDEGVSRNLGDRRFWLDFTHFGFFLLALLRLVKFTSKRVRECLFLLHHVFLCVVRYQRWATL